VYHACENSQQTDPRRCSSEDLLSFAEWQNLQGHLDLRHLQPSTRHIQLVDLSYQCLHRLCTIHLGLQAYTFLAGPIATAAVTFWVTGYSYRFPEDEKSLKICISNADMLLRAWHYPVVRSFHFTRGYAHKTAIFLHFRLARSNIDHSVATATLSRAVQTHNLHRICSCIQGVLH
jgi:hypothetical protein